MERKVSWGVLGTANIGVRETFAAMHQANNCHMAAIAGAVQRRHVHSRNGLALSAPARATTSC